MDIYFCDLCAVRVTDADLRAGHGIRSHWDVICGTCLEMGHGKDWLSQRTKPKAAVASPTLDAARDRLATLAEDSPADPVIGQPVTAVAAPGPSDPTQSDAHPVLSETDLTSTAKVPTPGRLKPVALASAASAFSALGQSAPISTKRSSTPPAISDETDDLPDAGHAPRADDTTPVHGAAVVTDAVSPFGFGTSLEKDETVPGLTSLPGTGDDNLAIEEKIPMPAPKDKSSTSSSSRLTNKKSTARPPTKPITGRTSAAKGGKTSTKTVARPRRGGQDPSRMILIGSMISLVIIGIVFAGIMKMRAHPPAQRAATIGTDDKDITELIKGTKQKVNDALRSDDLAAMETALVTLNATAARIEDFQKTAAKSGDGEDKVAGVLQRLGWPDVYMQSRSLRDRIQVLKHRQ